MPFTTGGVRSIFNNWFNGQAQSVSLHTGQAVTGGGGNEVTTAGYRRGAPGVNGWSYDDTDGTITNSNEISFGTVTANTRPITHWAILDGSSTILWRGSFSTAPGAIASGTALVLRSGDIDLRIPFE